MRRCRILLFALALATVGGCTKNNNPVQSTTCTYALSSATQSAGADGGASSINVTRTAGTCGWTAQSDASWITVSNASGGDTAALAYSVGANATTDSRIGHVTVSWTGGSAQLTVTQAGVVPPAVCAYSVNPVAITSPAAGNSGESTVTVTGSNCSWSAQSNQFWIHVTSGNSGTGTGTIGYTVDANAGGERFGRIIVTHTAGTTDIGFTQAGLTCTAALNPTTQAVSGSGGSFSTALTTVSGCTWTAASDASWLTISSATSGTGNATISYTAAGNPGAARTGHITVTAGSASAQLTVNQDVAPPLTAIFTVAPTPCPVTTASATTNLLSCVFDGSASTGVGINSYIFRLGSAAGQIVASGTSPVATNPTVPCGQGLAGSTGDVVAVDVFLTITSPAGSSTTANSVMFRRNTGC
jgi:all-beta uncharacterized protein